MPEPTSFAASLLQAATWRATSSGPAQTRALGQALAAGLGPGHVVGLVGEMGAGKTALVQGLAAGFGVVDLKDVTSPTYTLLNTYAVLGGTLFHLDLYRLDDLDAALALGLGDIVAQAAGPVLVEWADKIPELLPPRAAWLRITCQSGDARILEGFGLLAPAWPPAADTGLHGRA